MVYKFTNSLFRLFKVRYFCIMIPIRSLDHIAITVKDVEASAIWYEEVLGLKRMDFSDAWGPIPLMMFSEAGNGLALFPKENNSSREATLMHIAFLIDYKDLESAKSMLESKSIAVEFQDHKATHSIYFFDPDGYEIELTAPNPSYKK